MIKQFVPQEFCLRCQGCCRFKEQNSAWLPCLMDEEIQELLARKIPPAAISLDKKIQPSAHPKGEGYVCAFFNIDDNKCKIYDCRPFECQLYPFLINMRGRKVILTVDLNCPYAKENLKSRQFKEYADYLISFLNSPRQIRLLKDNPQLLNAYEDISEVIELNVFDDLGPYQHT